MGHYKDLNEFNSAYALIPGLAHFTDDVDITIDTTDAPASEDDSEKRDKIHYEQDKEIIEENLETKEDVLNADQDGDGSTKILDQSMRYDSLRYTEGFRKMRELRAELMQHLDAIDKALKYNSQIGQEGLFDSIKKGLTGIVNIFGHLVNLFGTTLFHGWRDFKRGEMQDYSDSNRLTMTRLYAADNYYALTKVEVDTPKGMIGTYSQALNALDTFLDTIRMTDRASLMVEVSRAISTDAKKQNPTFTSHVKSFSKQYDNRDILGLFNSCSRIFTNKSVSRNTFENLFASQSEYERVCKRCMDGDSYLRAVATVHDRLEETTKNFDNLLNHSANLTNNDLKELSRITRYFAEAFDMYGVCIQDRLRIDHNLTLVTKTIRKALRM